MRTVIVRDAMRIPLGKQGENNAVRVVWPKIAEKYAKLYGDGRFELVVAQKGKAYPAVVNVDGADLVWNVLAADVATAEVGSLELIYYVGDTIAKSQTWETLVVASKSADGMTEPPEDPARAWFDEIKRQIGDLSKLTTKAKENLVAAINEAARTGSGGGTVEMRVDGGYIQYSTDGMTWENLIAVADLEGKPGKDGDPGAPGAPGKDGDPGKDGHTPKIAATKTGKITSITADGVEIAQIKDGEDAASDLSLGITGAQVGQIAKITAVDETGKPTAWEAVEMPGEEKWEKIADIELRPDTAVYVLADFATWRKAKVIMTRPQYVSGLNKNVWCKVVGSDGGDTYNCGYLSMGYGYIFWEFAAEVNELFITTEALESNNIQVAQAVKSSGTFTPLKSPIETYKFELSFIDTSVIQEGDKVTVIGVRR